MLISLALYCYLCNLRNLLIVLGVVTVQIAIQCPKLPARLSHETTGCDNHQRLRNPIQN